MSPRRVGADAAAPRAVAGRRGPGAWPPARLAPPEARASAAAPANACRRRGARRRWRHRPRPPASSTPPGAPRHRHGRHVRPVGHDRHRHAARASPVPIWGFSPAGAAGSATAPGPVLVVNQGDTVTVTLHNRCRRRVSLAFPASRPPRFTAGLGDDRRRRPPAHRRPTRFTAGRARHLPLRGRPHRRRRPPGGDGPGRRAGRAARRRHGLRRHAARGTRTTTRRCSCSARSTPR